MGSPPELQRLAGTLVRDGTTAPGHVGVAEGRIVEVVTGTAAPDDAERVDGLIAPGLVDLQVNGAFGHDVGDDDAALDALEAGLLAAGVTAWLPTVTTRAPEDAREAIERLAARAADPSSTVLGVHVEGPALSAEHPGAHPPDLLADASDGLPDYATRDGVALVTLAPEVPGALDAIAALRARGIHVALGHSGADARTALAALDAGAGLVTHLFNAMAPLGHRDPGLAGVALADPRPAVSVIADGIHVDPLVLTIARRALGARLILVSDASAPAARSEAPSDPERLGPVAIARDEDRVTTSTGTLAGAAVLLDEAVRRFARHTGAPLAEAWAAASERPARLLGRLHGLVPGAPADLVVLDGEGLVRRVMRAGGWV